MSRSDFKTAPKLGRLRGRWQLAGSLGVQDVSFCFGPNNTYFLRTPNGVSYSALPDTPAVAEFAEQAGPLGDVALAMEAGTYMVARSWRTKEEGGERYKIKGMDTHYARLARFIARNLGQTQNTTFGPNHSYFSSVPFGYIWGNLPDTLEDYLVDHVKASHPLMITLGAEGTYVLFDDYDLMNNKMPFPWHLSSQGQNLYPEVEAFFVPLEGDCPYPRGRLHYLALNPYVPGEYFALFTDNSTSWKLPQEWSDAIVDTITKNGWTAHRQVPGPNGPQ